MSRKALAIAAHAFVLALALAAAPALAEDQKAEEEEFRFGSEPEIRHVRPGKPVKIRLKRTAEGKYSWDIEGDTPEEIAKADAKLREYLNLR